MDTLWDIASRLALIALVAAAAAAAGDYAASQYDKGWWAGWDTHRDLTQRIQEPDEAGARS